MNLPPLPKNFASAVDLSTLGRPAAEAASIPGIAITQANLISEILPASNNKVVILICWSPRSVQAISLLEVMGKYLESDILEDGEPAWILGTVNVDTRDRSSTGAASSIRTGCNCNYPRADGSVI